MASFHLDKRRLAKCNYFIKVNEKELLNLLLTHILASILQDLADFIFLECVISLREAFFFDRNCKLIRWQILRIRLLLIFSKTYRYLAKRTMQRFVLH